MAAAVNDRDHDHAIAFHLVEDAEREASHPGPPRVPVNDGVAERHLRNRGKSPQYLIEKLLSEPALLGFVPNGRVFEIFLDFASKAYLDGHSRRRMSAIASVASRPRSLSTAYASSRLSS